MSRSKKTVKLNKDVTVDGLLDSSIASIYVPKTRETRSAYEDLLSQVSSLIGDQPFDILHGAAEEILLILKEDGVKDIDRMGKISKIIPKINVEKYTKLSSTGKRITDFLPSSTGVTSATAETSGKQTEEMEELGVAVIFDDEDEDENNAGDSEGSEDEQEEGVETNQMGRLQGERVADPDNQLDASTELSVHEIDAHWLQREISKFYADANVSVRLAEEVLLALGMKDERAAENQLVILLDFDKFAFIKRLLKNRGKIYYCSRLKQAQTEEQREQIVQEMTLDLSAGGPSILAQLQQKASAESWTQVLFVLYLFLFKVFLSQTVGFIRIVSGSLPRRREERRESSLEGIPSSPMLRARNIWGTRMMS